jgi:hypothetical protein
VRRRASRAPRASPLGAGVRGPRRRSGGRATRTGPAEALRQSDGGDVRPGVRDSRRSDPDRLLTRLDGRTLSGTAAGRCPPPSRTTNIGAACRSSGRSPRTWRAHGSARQRRAFSIRRDDAAHARNQGES